MAVIKYQINGKADTKPIKAIEDAAAGMAKKIFSVNNMLKGFVGVKVFSGVEQQIKKSLKSYDQFKKSLDEDSNFSKQFANLKTTLAGTIGTVRDEFSRVMDNIAGTDGFKKLEETIPKVGAALIASFKVAEAIVQNIKENFDALRHPKMWDDFFSHAHDLASVFVSAFGNLLIDVLLNALEVFKWGVKGLGIADMLWETMRNITNAIVRMQGPMNDATKAAMDELDRQVAAEKERENVFPELRLSDKTKSALSDFSKELGKTFKSLFDTLAGTNVQEIYDKAYGEALAKVGANISAMNGEELAAVLRDLKNTLSARARGASSSAGDAFSQAASYIESILGSATAEQAEKIREKMEGLNKQFAAATVKIDALFDELENAKSAEAVEKVFKQINDQAAHITELSAAMASLDKIIVKTIRDFKTLGEKLGVELGEQLGAAGLQLGKLLGSKLGAAFGRSGLWGALLGGKLMEAGKLLGQTLGNIVNLFGDVSEAINIAFANGPLGLIITLISRLFDAFAKISGPFAAFMNSFDVFFDAIEEVCAVLEPALSAIFKPIVDIVRQLGIVFGTFLVMLKPIFEIVGFLANVIGHVLSPILYGLGLVFAHLADGFAHVFNVVSGIVRGLTFGFVDLGHKDADNVKKFNEAWNSELDYDQYQNNSTSYSVSGDMYITINFSHSYVNGDSREIALMLRDEIRLIEGQGY